MAPCTPPKRSNLPPRMRSRTPEKRKRDNFPDVVPQQLREVCLPLSDGADSVAIGTPPVPLSPPPCDGGEPLAKRRRIRGKGGHSSLPVDPAPKKLVGTGERDVAEDARFVEFVPTVAWPTEEVWNDMAAKLCRQFVWDKMKGAWCKMRAEAMKNDVGLVIKCHSGGWQSRWKDAREQFVLLTPDRRQRLLHLFLDATSAPEWVLSRLIYDKQDGVYTRKKVQSALYTWVSKAWTLAPAAGKARNVEVAVSVARRIGWVRQLYDEFLQFARSQVEDLPGVDWAVTAEICTQTLEQEAVALLHFHLLLRHVDSAIWMPGPSLMKFKDHRPHVAGCPLLSGGRLTSQRTWAGYFYCCVPKVGQVFVDASKVPFRDFPVQGQWIMALLQAGKISLATARGLVYRVTHGVTRLLADLDAVQRQREQDVVQAAQEKALALLDGQLLSFPVVPPVEKWSATFDELRARYQFCVLDGPSGMGKTAYARSKCPSGMEVLEINCAAGGDPDLRPYTYGRHGLILCDEIEAEAVAAQRKLFQAGTSLVQLGTSPTNIHVYSVFVHRVRIICASNNWAESLARLTPADRAWVEANSVYVWVDKPLWVEG